MGLERLLTKWKEFRYTKSFSVPEINLRKPDISRRGFGRIVLGAGIALVLAGAGYKGWEMLGGSSLDRYLPKGFKGLEMGMSYQELREVRPFVKTSREEGEVYEFLDYGKCKNILDFFGYHEGDIKTRVEYSFGNNELKEISFDMQGGGTNYYEFLVDRYKDELGKPTYESERTRDVSWEKDNLKLRIDGLGFARGGKVHDVIRTVWEIEQIEGERE